ncbi:hypothetical protein N9V96_04215, partial [Polaribacter sp.]|nr:hypothetical protein [Polaribacter sp.]
MRKIITIFLMVFLANSYAQEKQKFKTLFETSNGTETPEYQEVISFYKKLADEYSKISLFEFGMTDAGFPLHLVVYNDKPITDVNQITNSNK